MIIYRSISNLYTFESFISIFGTYINPHLVHLWHPTAVFWRHQMNGTLSSDSTDDSLFGQNINPATGNDRAIMTTNCIEVQKSFITYMFYDQPQLINVAGKHEGWTTFRTKRGMATTQGID